MTTRRKFPGYDLARARRYGRIRRSAALAGMATSTAFDLARIATGRTARVRERIGQTIRQPELADAVHIALTLGEGWALGLPERAATGWWLERRYGMTTRSFRSWLADDLKGLALGVAIGAPVAAGALSVVRRRPDDWHIVLPAIAAPLQVAVGALAPVVLMPIFNRFDPIEPGPLRDRIEELADQAGVTVQGAYTIDLSRQTERANAFFAGIGPSRRIVLGDTLLRSFPDDEVAGVVAHELGHQAHADIWRSALLGAAGTFGAAWGLKVAMPRLTQAASPWTGSDRFDTSAALPVWSLALGGFGAIGGPLFAAYSRRVERRTDAFAIALTGDSAAYARGMERLMRQNLSDPYPPRWATILWGSHPPVGERIERALAVAEASHSGRMRRAIDSPR
jgi:STE24 endopeptidase